MIITISGKPGSGKSTVAELVAKKLKLRHYSCGDYYREMAIKRGMDVIELGKTAEKNKNIDKELDQWQKNLGKKDNFVIDSRLGFHFIPKSKKIFLDVSVKEGSKRIFNDKRKEERNITLKQTTKNIKNRIGMDRKRYKRYYGLDYFNKKNYDLIINTTNKPVNQVVKEIISFLKKKPKSL